MAHSCGAGPVERVSEGIVVQPVIGNTMQWITDDSPSFVPDLAVDERRLQWPTLPLRLLAHYARQQARRDNSKD